MAIGTDNDNWRICRWSISSCTVDTLVSLGNETGTSKSDWKEVQQLPKHGQMEQVLRPLKLYYQRPLPADSPRAHAIGESGLFNIQHLQCFKDTGIVLCMAQEIPSMSIQVMECLQDKHLQMFHSQMATR